MAALSVSPDILVGPDASVIAMRVGGSVFIEHGKRASAFGLAAAPKLWGLGPAQDFPAAGEAGGAVLCDAGLCRMRIRDRSVLLVRNADRLPCESAVLVSAETLRSACGDATVADRALIRRSGAAAIRLGGKTPVLVTDLSIRGERPWVIRGRVLLPPAQTE